MRKHVYKGHALVLRKYLIIPYIHTCMHNWSLLSFSRDYGLASPKWRGGLQVRLRMTYFLENFFMAGLFTLRVFASFCWEEISKEIYEPGGFQHNRECSKNDVLSNQTILSASFVRWSYPRRFSNHDCFLQTQLHTRLTEFLLSRRLLCSALF